MTDRSDDIAVYVPYVTPDMQVRNTLSKVAVTLEMASLPQSDIDSKISSIDLTLAYLLRLRAQLIVRRMMLRLKTNPGKKVW